MAPKRDWVDYTNLAANVVQTAQLDGINSKMRQMAELELHKEYREQQEAAVARHEDLLRESVFFFSEQLRDVEEVASQYPTAAYVRASHAKRLYESVPQFKSSGFRKFEDKERMANVQRAYDRMIRECAGRLTPDDLIKCNESIEHLFHREDLLELISVQEQAEKLDDERERNRITLPHRLVVTQEKLQKAKQQENDGAASLRLLQSSVKVCAAVAVLAFIVLFVSTVVILNTDGNDLRLVYTSLSLFIPSSLLTAMLTQKLKERKLKSEELSKTVVDLEFEIKMMNDDSSIVETTIQQYQTLYANFGIANSGDYRRTLRDRDALLIQMVGDYAKGIGQSI